MQRLLVLAAMFLLLGCSVPDMKVSGTVQDTTGAESAKKSDEWYQAEYLRHKARRLALIEEKRQASWRAARENNERREAEEIASFEAYDIEAKRLGGGCERELTIAMKKYKRLPEKINEYRASGYSSQTYSWGSFYLTLRQIENGDGPTTCKWSTYNT